MHLINVPLQYLTTKTLDITTKGSMNPKDSTDGLAIRGSRYELKEKRNRPYAMTILPPCRSASDPPSNWVAEYPHKKAD